MSSEAVTKTGSTGEHSSRVWENKLCSVNETVWFPSVKFSLAWASR